MLITFFLGLASFCRDKNFLYVLWSVSEEEEVNSAGWICLIKCREIIMSNREWKSLGKIRCRQCLCLFRWLWRGKLNSLRRRRQLYWVLSPLSAPHCSLNGLGILSFFSTFLLNYLLSLLLSSLVSTGLDLRNWKALCIEKHEFLLIMFIIPWKYSHGIIIETLPNLMSIWSRWFLTHHQHIMSSDAVMRGMCAWQRIEL